MKTLHKKKHRDFSEVKFNNNKKLIKNREKEKPNPIKY